MSPCGCGCGTMVTRRFAQGHWRRADVLRRYEERDQGFESLCWVWTGSLGSKGYGRFRHEGHTQLAHRWYYEHHVGPIPEGLTIDHLCRNRACVNPAHMEVVSIKENVRRAPHHKLDLEMAREIRRRYPNEGRPQTAFATEFGVSQRAISKVLNGGLWAEEVAI